jgi:hypothetical protein
MSLKLPAIFEGIPWQFISKGLLGVSGRPGWTLRSRTLTALTLLSEGYAGTAGGEIAIKQIPTEALGDAKNFIAVSPDGLRRHILKIEIEACRAAGVELDEKQRKDHLVSGPAMRAMLEELEVHDGAITRVRFNRSAKNLLIGLSYDEALKAAHITPVRDLPLKERRKLNGKCFIYVHATPRPATIEALTRRVDQERASGAAPSKTDDNSAAVLTNQLFADWGTEFGIDPELLKQRPEMRALIAELQRLDERRRKDEDAYQRKLLLARSKAELIARGARSPTIAGAQEPLFPAPGPATPAPPPVSAPLNPTGEEAPSVSNPPSRRGAESPIVSMPRSAEAYQLLDELRRYVNADLEGAREMIRRCRAHAPLVTIAQLAAWAESMAPTARGKANPFGWLLVYLPKKFEGAPIAVDTQTMEYDIPPEPEAAKRIRELLAKVHACQQAARKELRDAGTSSIAMERAQAKLHRLSADEQHLQAQLDELLNPAATRPKEAASERPEAAGAARSGD